MNIEAVKTWQRTVVHDYTARDSALYALAVGAVSDPLDPLQLRLVDETDQVAVPSMAAVLASPGFWARNEKSMEIDAARLIHGEQRIALVRPLPPHGRVIGISRVSRVVDKGKDKGALMTFTRAMAKELGPRGIRVNALCCGMIATRFHDDFTKPEVRTAVAGATPLRRQGHPGEAADTAVYLASDAAGFVTGANVDVNGGTFFS